MEVSRVAKYLDDIGLTYVAEKIKSLSRASKIC